MAEPPLASPPGKAGPAFEERLRRFVVKELLEFGAGPAAQDLAGEVMVRYARVRPVRYVPWLRRTLRNVAIDQWRRGTIKLEGRRVPVGIEGLPPVSFVSDPAAGGPWGRCRRRCSPRACRPPRPTATSPAA